MACVIVNQSIKIHLYSAVCCERFRGTCC